MKVRFGAMAPTLKEQGFDDQKGHLQEDVNAICRLRARGVLTLSECRNAEKRIVKCLKPLPKESEAND